MRIVLRLPIIGKNYIINDCHEIPSQYIRKGIPKNKTISRDVKSRVVFFLKKFDFPNIKFTQDRKKNVGPSKYKNTIKIKDIIGKRSKKNEKNKNSETKKIEPGKPKNIKLFNKIARNNFGHKKFKPLISVIKRVLNRRATASTSKNELVDNNAWLINIQKFASSRFD